MEIKLGSYPCILRCPLALVSSLLQGSEQQDLGLKFECGLHKKEKEINYYAEHASLHKIHT